MGRLPTCCSSVGGAKYFTCRNTSAMRYSTTVVVIHVYLMEHSVPKVTSVPSKSEDHLTTLALPGKVSNVGTVP